MFANILKKSLVGLRFLVIGPQLIKQGYEKVCLLLIYTVAFSLTFISKSSRSAYTVPTTHNNLILLSSEEQIRELSQAPETILSLHSVARDVSPFS